MVVARVEIDCELDDSDELPWYMYSSNLRVNSMVCSSVKSAADGFMA